MEIFKFLKFNKNNKRLLCIDFGESFIKVASLENRHDTYSLLAYGLLEFGATQKTQQDVSHFLRQLLENNSILEKEVAFSISDPEGVFIKKLSLPRMPKDGLLNAVKTQLKQELSFDSDESVSDYQVIREYADSGGFKKIELLCVFVKKEIISKYLQAVSACGLLPNRISTSAFNYCGTLSSLPANPQISAVLDIAGTHSYIAIYQNNKLHFVMNLNFSTEKLRAALVGILVTDKGRVEITIQKAKDLLAQFGVSLNEGIVLEPGIRGAHIIPLVRPLLETLVKELQRSFDYFKSESGLSVPQSLYITGGGANLKNLDTYLTGQLNIKVAKLPVPEALDIHKVDAQKFSLEANQLSGVLGLGVVTDGINLLPPEMKNHKSEPIKKTTLLILVITLIFVWSNALVKMRLVQPVSTQPLSIQENSSLPLASQVNSSKNLNSVDLLEQKPQPVEPESDSSVAASAESEETLRSEMVLTGIFWDKVKPLAIIDGRVVKKGQRVGSKMLIDIKRDRVILSDGQALSEIRLKQ